MQCIEKTIAHISGAFVCELILRKTKCNNREFCIMGKHSDGTAAANILRLNDTSHECSCAVTLKVQISHVANPKAL